MNRLIYADSGSSADIYYATRFFAPDPFLYFTVGKKSCVVLSDLELDRGRRQARVDRVLSLSMYRDELAKKIRRRPNIEETVLHILKAHRIKTAEVPPDFPFKLADFLIKSGVKLAIPPGGFFPQRFRKTASEVRQIQRALRVTEMLLDRAREILKRSKAGPGGKLRWAGSALTSERLRMEIQMAALRMGACADMPIVAGGVQACDPHERGSGPLKANELIIVDIFPQLADTRYWGDMTRTFLKGRALPGQRRLFETVRLAQEEAIRAIRAGVPAGKVHHDVEQFFGKRGFLTGEIRGRRQGFFHGTGHGLGLEIHEAPGMGQGSPHRLEAGNVVTVEPGLYYPDIGGIRIEDVVLVTRTGCRKLSRFPVVLEL